MEHTNEELNSENQNAASEQKKITAKVPDLSKEKWLQRFEKAKNWVNRKFTRKRLITACLVLVVLIGGIMGVRYATNNYMTPIHTAAKQENQKSINVKKYLRTGFRNMGAKNAGELVNILCESDDFLDLMDDVEENFDKNYEQKLDNFGDDFKVTYAVEDKLKLEKSDLHNYQKWFRQYVKAIEEGLEDTEDFTTSDWGDFADELGLTRTQAKKYVAALKKMVSNIGRLEVTKGYELGVTVTITGSELDEPAEHNSTIQVVKVNGRWIAVDAFAEIVKYIVF